MKKCQFVSDQERLSAFDVLLTATICEAKSIKPPQDNVNVHRAAAKIIVSKSRAARGSVCNVLLSIFAEREVEFLAGLFLAN